MGEAGLNIATLNLGRDKPGGDAICIVAIDEPVSDGGAGQGAGAAAGRAREPAGVLTRRVLNGVRPLASNIGLQWRRSCARGLTPLPYDYGLLIPPYLPQPHWRHESRYPGADRFSRPGNAARRARREEWSMRTALALLVLPALLSAAHAADVKGTSRIDAVTVFPSGAEITRVGKVQARARRPRHPVHGSAGARHRTARSASRARPRARSRSARSTAAASSCRAPTMPSPPPRGSASRTPSRSSRTTRPCCRRPCRRPRCRRR